MPPMPTRTNTSPGPTSPASISSRRKSVAAWSLRHMQRNLIDLSLFGKSGGTRQSGNGEPVPVAREQHRLRRVETDAYRLPGAQVAVPLFDHHHLVAGNTVIAVRRLGVVEPNAHDGL